MSDTTLLESLEILNPYSPGGLSGRLFESSSCNLNYNFFFFFIHFKGKVVTEVYMTPPPPPIHAVIVIFRKTISFLSN